MKMHEPFHGTAGDVVPITMQLMPDLAGAVATPALGVDRLDLLEILLVLPRAI